MSMRLDTLDDRPELTIGVGGREYHFSEITIAGRADLQAYLRRTVPHPIDAIRPHLEGLTAEERRWLLEEARDRARSWPPDLGTPAGWLALTATTDGQVELLMAGLSLHHPGATRDDASRLYLDLEREARREALAAARRGEPYDPSTGTARRIYAVICGLGDPATEEPMILPEGSGPDRTRASIGASSTAPVINGSA